LAGNYWIDGYITAFSAGYIELRVMDTRNNISIGTAGRFAAESSTVTMPYQAFLTCDNNTPIQVQIRNQTSFMNCPFDQGASGSTAVGNFFRVTKMSDQQMKALAVAFRNIPQ
jgi:hypothetical protein